MQNPKVFHWKLTIKIKIMWMLVLNYLSLFLRLHTVIHWNRSLSIVNTSPFLTMLMKNSKKIYRSTYIITNLTTSLSQVLISFPYSSIEHYKVIPSVSITRQFIYCNIISPLVVISLKFSGLLFKLRFEIIFAPPFLEILSNQFINAIWYTYFYPRGNFSAGRE